MLDLSPITNRVATGGSIESPADIRRLRDLGVTAVISCCEEDDRKLLCDAFWDPEAYLWAPTADDGQPKGADWFGRGIGFGLAALSRPRERLYIHCAQGINRGPSMAYAVLRATGLSSRLVERMIRAARPEVGLRYVGDADRAIRELGYD